MCLAGGLPPGLLDRPAAPKMVRVAREMGLDLAAHRSQALSVELVDWADRVLVMEQAHALEVRRIAPLAPIQAVSLLGPYAGVAEIDDPIGSWTLRPFRRTRQVVERAVRALLIEVAAQDSPHA